MDGRWPGGRVGALRGTDRRGVGRGHRGLAGSGPAGVATPCGGFHRSHAAEGASAHGGSDPRRVGGRAGDGCPRRRAGSPQDLQRRTLDRRRRVPQATPSALRRVRAARIDPARPDRLLRLAHVPHVPGPGRAASAAGRRPRCRHRHLLRNRLPGDGGRPSPRRRPARHHQQRHLVRRLHRPSAAPADRPHEGLGKRPLPAARHQQRHHGHRRRSWPGGGRAAPVPPRRAVRHRLRHQRRDALQPFREHAGADAAGDNGGGTGHLDRPAWGRGETHRRGAMELAVPRGRLGRFEPQLVEKHVRRLPASTSSQRG